MAELNWTDAQWQKMNDTVTESFGKASVASAILPCYGPLVGSAETVRNERLVGQGTTIELERDHDAANLQLVNLTVRVQLSSEQVADESLSNAALAFRRAANVLALAEDLIVFGGYDRGDPRSPYVTNNKLKPQKGLADLFARQDFRNIPGGASPSGQDIVSALVRAIHRLEDRSNPGPFACVLGNELFDKVHEPSPSLVLPADRIAPLLKGGGLMRSGEMNTNSGIVISLSGTAVDIVVGVPPTVQFLQRSENAKYLFRVYERFVLRIRDKEKLPVAGFRIERNRTQNIREKEALLKLREAAAILPYAKVVVARAERDSV